MTDELIALISDALGASARVLADKAASGEITASEIAQLRALFKDAGGALQSSQGTTTVAGDSVLSGMADLDEETLNQLIN
jgi:hypothetical protein